jgi:phage baseplate assembly protein W
MPTTSFLGTGWSFPPTFDKNTASVAMTSDEQDIQCSLQILLSTRQGERVLLPDYGCDLEPLVFEPMSTTFNTYIKNLVETAVQTYEPRITLNSVNLATDQEVQGIILIEVDYTVKATNSRFNLVFPYYKTEGTLLPAR